MNIALWVLQVLLALHTLMGAVWKFANSEQVVPSLKALPHAVWSGLGILEVLCVVGLFLPAFGKRFSRAAPIAAGFIVAEMLLYMGVHFASGATEHGEPVYWLVVAALAGLLAWGRMRQTTTAAAA